MADQRELNPLKLIYYFLAENFLQTEIIVRYAQLPIDHIVIYKSPHESPHHIEIYKSPRTIKVIATGTKTTMLRYCALLMARPWRVLQNIEYDLADPRFSEKILEDIRTYFS